MQQLCYSLMDATALQPFCLLAKSAKGKALTAIIEQALNSPNVYVFGELLQSPNVIALESTEHKPHLELLRIFAYGTYQDYKKSQNLPPLSPQMLTKLKQLTIVSLSAEHKVIPYTVLLQQLDISNLRELEDLVIECIYQELIKGKLDQKYQQLEIDFAIGRDITPVQLEHMMAVLGKWVQRSETLLKTIEEKVEYAKEMHSQHRAERLDFEQRLDVVKSTIKASTEVDMFHPSAGHEYDSPEYFDERTRKSRANKLKGKDYRRV